MTSKQKRSNGFRLLLAAIIVFFLLVVGITSYVGYSIDESGGVKQVLIEFGKDMKDIGQAVDEYDPK